MNQGPYKHQSSFSVSVPCFTPEWKSPWVVITQGLGFTYKSPETGYGGSCSVAVCPLRLAQLCTQSKARPVMRFTEQLSDMMRAFKSFLRRGLVLKMIPCLLCRQVF